MLKRSFGILDFASSYILGLFENGLSAMDQDKICL